jgi:hypothetical protein
LSRGPWIIGKDKDFRGVLTFTVAKVRLLEYDLVYLHKAVYLVRLAVAT